MTAGAATPLEEGDGLGARRPDFALSCWQDGKTILWHGSSAGGGPAVDLCALRGKRGLMSALWHEPMPSSGIMA